MSTGRDKQSLTGKQGFESQGSRALFAGGVAQEGGAWMWGLREYGDK